METKICKDCNVEKELSEYKKERGDYYYPVCKKCNYQRYKEKSKKSTKKWNY